MYDDELIKTIQSELEDIEDHPLTPWKAKEGKRLRRILNKMQASKQRQMKTG